MDNSSLICSFKTTFFFREAVLIYLFLKICITEPFVGQGHFKNAVKIARNRVPSSKETALVFLGEHVHMCYYACSLEFHKLPETFGSAFGTLMSNY